MAIQPTRPEAYDTGTLNQYAHIYDVQAEEKRARIAEETEEAARIAADDAEKKARIAADDAEKQARIAADDAEKQARIAADDALGKRIDASAVEQMTPIKLTDDDKTASRQPVASGTRSLAFGPGAKATANQSVALGAFSQTSSRGNTVSVGSENLQRRIEYVDDPQAGTDAVNLRYFNENSSIPTIETGHTGDWVISDSEGKLTPEFSNLLASLPTGVVKFDASLRFWSAPVYKDFSSGSSSETYINAGSPCIITRAIALGFEYKILSSPTRATSGAPLSSVNNFMWQTLIINTSQNLPVGYASMQNTLINGLDGINVKYDSDGVINIGNATASNSSKGIVQGSDSITIADGVAKVNSSIFGDGLTTTDGKVSVDTGFVGEHLAGDALYYDSTDGLMVKTGAGLHIDNDTLSVDQDTLPLASAENRGTVKVGKGLTISTDGALSTSGNLIYGTLATDAALLSDGVKSVVLSTIFDPSNTYLLHARITVVPKSTFAVGTKMTVSTSPIVPRFFHQLVEFFKRNTMCAAITISGSSIYTINNEGFDVTFKDANGILDFTVSMTNATLSPTQNLVIGSYY